MKMLFDLLPVILFFVAYKAAHANPESALELAQGWLGSNLTATQAPILLATAVVIVATVLQAVWVWFRHHKVERMMLVSLALVVVLGGATLLFQNPDFFKWKPTALYWLFAAILAGATLFRKNLIRSMLQAQLRLPDPVWSRVNAAWAVFFALMGALNLYVAYSFSEEAWVNFKMFGIMGMMFVFVIGQGFYLSKYIEEEPSA
jgi:intracellular septation protein